MESNIAMIKVLLCLLIIFLNVPQQSFAGKLTLKEAIEEAIAHNPELLSADREIRAAKAGFWEAVSPENPELFTEYEDIPDGSHSLSDFGEKKIGIAQELEFPLVYYFRGRWQNLEKNNINSEYLLLRNDVMVGVKKSFFKIILLEKKIQLYEDIARHTRNLYQKARIRVEAGESASYDTLKIKVDLAEVENAVMTLKNDYEIARYELGLLMGREKGDVIEIEGDLLFTPVPLNKDSLKQAAIENHPLMKEAFAKVSQKNIEKNLSWLELMPNINMTYFHQEFPDEPSPKAWGGEIGITIPFWAFLRGQGKIRGASHELEAAKWQVESEKMHVFLEIEESYSQLIVVEKQVMNYRENTLREVEELVRIATRSYEEGEMGYLEVAEAFRSIVAQAELENAVGISLFGEE